MNTSRRHLFHILKVSPWPIITATGVLFLVSGLTFYMHKLRNGYMILFLGILILACSSYKWVIDILDEATFSGDHSLAVQMGITFGFLLFIVSEIMLFFGFFWAFFHSSISPSILLGAEFPPVGITIIPVFMFPLYNTCLLLLSGITVTWLHKAINLGFYKDAIDSFFLTIFLGLAFFVLQMFEYYESPFSFYNSVYGCSFFMLTGLHGFHVFVGIVCLFLSFLRLIKNHYTTKHHNGLIFAIWYWHFVDVVWIFLFLTVYCWGNNVLVI